MSQDLAELIVKERGDLFEELVKTYPKIKVAFIAETLTSTLREIKRKYKLDPTRLNEDHFRAIFKHLSEDKFPKDIILDVLIDMIKDNFNLKKYESLSSEDLHKTIKQIVDKNKKAPFGALMGMCMKKLAGKASGEIISKELKKLLN